jgi:hypothetical protein
VPRLEHPSRPIKAGVHVYAGVKGALKGVAKGFWALGSRPVKGLRLAASKARRQMTGSRRFGDDVSDSYCVVPDDVEG